MELGFQACPWENGSKCMFWCDFKLWQYPPLIEQENALEMHPGILSCQPHQLGLVSKIICPNVASFSLFNGEMLSTI